ncbi:thyroid transcription factor 1-associated protein 26 homolog [Leucoraja erinacea]|uniref:thyroid transcription factor 1-associated protein 26 homolog n=1 Tax=Leucoraja erinaceus TaxID=7782 RepID=UPI002456CAB8|nr:thyroid transcription factor 1-associated protein 26 homolog [Leucoraja erinacea]
MGGWRPRRHAHGVAGTSPRPHDVDEGKMAPSGAWRGRGGGGSRRLTGAGDDSGSRGPCDGDDGSRPGNRAKGASRTDKTTISKKKYQRNPNHFKKRWGSVKEGKGFAFQQKEKIKYEYKKLLRKEKGQQLPQKVEYTDNYPDHLRHLYLAEEEFLKKQSKKPKHEESETNQVDSQEVTIKKKKKLSSYQKTKEEYEKRQAEYIQKKEAAEKRQKDKEEAQRKYKEQKLERYKMLCKKTRTGQPNLNLQMEYLLKKIQDKT